MEKLTEEASVCSPLPDARRSDTGQCPKEPWTSAEAPQVNGRQEVIVWEEVEVPATKMHREDQIHPDSYGLADLQIPEEVEEDQWEATVLPVYPMSQPTAPLSFATVQWDTPDPSSDTPSPMTDTSSADELDSSGGASLDWTVNPLSLHRFKETDIEVSTQDDTEKRNGLEALWSLKMTADQEESVSQAADLCCNLQPCDNVDVEEQTTHQEEDVPIELLEDNDEILLRFYPGGEKGDTVEPVETVPCPLESADPEPGVERESPLDSRLEEEQEKPDILLTGQTDSAQETSPATANGVKTEEESEEGREGDEDQTLTSEAFNGECDEGKTVDCNCPCEKVQAGEPTQIDHIGITVMPDQLIHIVKSEKLMEGEQLQNKTGSEADKELLEHLHGLGEQSKDLEDSEQSELPSDICPALIELCENTGSTNKTEESPAKCEEVNQEAQAEPSEATQQPEHDEDAQKQQAYNGEGSENSGAKEPEQPEQSIKQKQENCFEEQSQQTHHSQQTTASKELEPSEQTQHSESQQSGECEQSEQTEEPVQMEQSHQTESLNQTQCSEDSEQSKQPEHLDESQPTEQLKQPEHLEQSQPTEQSKQPEHLEQSQPTEQTDQTKQPEHLEQLQPMDQSKQPEHLEQSQPTEQSKQPEHLDQSQPADQTKQPEHLGQSQQMEQTDQSKQPEDLEQSQQMEQTDQSKQPEDLEQSQQMEQTDQSKQPEDLEQSQPTEQTDQSKQPEDLEQSQQMEQADQSKQPEDLEQSQPTEQTDQSKQPEHLEQSQPTDQSKQPEHREQLQPTDQSKQPEHLNESQPTQQTDQSKQEVSVLPADTDLTQEDKQTDKSEQTEHPECAEDASLQTVVENGEKSEPLGTAEPLMNRGGVDREKASRLAERLHQLDGIQRTDVVKHMDKDNDFSRAVGEEYLKFFDFTDQTLDQALRSFLKVVVLIGETQERERVLQRFSSRFHQCNPQSLCSAGSVLTLTCALMLLNTDLHGQNVGKAMSISDFLSNLDGMNEGQNFNKDVLKSLYNAIKTEPFEWAVGENELMTSMLLEEDAKEDAPPRSKSNPFQDVPHDKKATVFKQGFLQRKAHADIDGKRIPWGKRSWKTFYGVLKGMVLYLQKDEYRKEYQSTEEVVSVHHALAERAADYTKRPHVFRLQTADWRVFLFQASSRAEMNSWIGRINLVSALHSSPPFPAAVGSQRRFCRPILPASQSAHTLEHQLQSHAGMLESFQEDLAYLQQGLPEGRRAKAKELEEHRLREEYLQHEKCRYEIYIQVLEAWKGLNEKADTAVGAAELDLFDRALCKDYSEEMGEEGEEVEGLKKSHSSPALDLEMAPPPLVKVRRNISERRTYRRIIIPRRNKDL